MLRQSNAKYGWSSRLRQDLIGPSSHAKDFSLYPVVNKKHLKNSESVVGMNKCAILKDCLSCGVESGLEEGKCGRKNWIGGSCNKPDKKLIITCLSVVVVGREKSGCYVRYFTHGLSGDRFNGEWEIVESQVTPRSLVYSTDEGVVLQNKKATLRGDGLLQSQHL